MDTLTELSLFTGYAGFTLGLRLTGIPVRTVCYVEIDRYCQEIIKARIGDGLLDDAPIWDDIRTFDGRPFDGMVDIVTAGVPCQWISKARGAVASPLDPLNLWPHTLRIVALARPSFIILENPANLSRYYYHVIRPRLQELGYETQERLQSAIETGAPHIRERLYVAAYTSDSRFRKLFQSIQESKRISKTDIRRNGEIQLMADSTEQRWCAWPQHPRRQTARQDWWAAEPTIPRVDDGSPFRVAQIRAAGEGCVPAVVAEFLRRVTVPIHGGKHNDL